MSSGGLVLMASMAAAGLFFGSGFLLGSRSRPGVGRAAPSPTPPSEGEVGQPEEPPRSMRELLQRIGDGRGAALIDSDGLLVRSEGFDPGAELAVSAALLARTKLIGGGLTRFDLQGPDGASYTVQALPGAAAPFLAITRSPAKSVEGVCLDELLPTLWDGAAG